MSTRVVKLGGSLLGHADLFERLESWLKQQPPATNLFVVGGGEAVELIRRNQKAWRFDDELAHVAAIRAMDVNAERVAAGWATVRLWKNWSPEVDVPAGAAVVLACADWAAGETAFERSWRTTSDSIAAEVASQVAATELVLLKSCLPDRAREPASFVDPLFFQHLPMAIGVRLVDFSGREFPEVVLVRQSEVG